MGHSLIRIWVHAIWTTKSALPLIAPRVENLIYGAMRDEFQCIGCPVLIINGTVDHVHSLFGMKPEISLAAIIKQVKGGSSHYINQHDIINDKFAWQEGYAAFSVNEPSISYVYKYILNQKKHHHRRDFKEEMDWLKNKVMDTSGLI